MIVVDLSTFGRQADRQGMSDLLALAASGLLSVSAEKPLVGSLAERSPLIILVLGLVDKSLPLISAGLVVMAIEISAWLRRRCKGRQCRPVDDRLYQASPSLGEVFHARAL